MPYQNHETLSSDLLPADAFPDDGTTEGVARWPETFAQQAKVRKRL